MRPLIVLTLLLHLLAPLARAQEDDGPSAPVPGGATVLRDVPYVASASALQRLDLYVPPGDARARPIAVYVHGGGWRRGDKARVGDKARLFLEAGFLFASVNYRLSPEVVHPAHVEDVAASLAWLRAHAAERGGDPDRLVLIGHSAGAHLVALVAVDARRLEAAGVPQAAIRGVIPLDGAGYDIPRQVEESPLARPMFEAAFGAEVEGQRDASPVLRVAAGGKPPPFLLVHAGRRAASAAQAGALAAAIRAAGGAATLHAEPSKSHGTVNRDIGREGDPLTDAVLGFARRVTAPAKAAPAEF